MLLYFDHKKDIYYFLRVPLFLIISSVLILSYVRIVYFLWKQRRSMVGTHMLGGQSQSNCGKKTTVVMALVVSIYVITTVPVVTYNATISYDATKRESWRFQISCSFCTIVVLLSTLLFMHQGFLYSKRPVGRCFVESVTWVEIELMC